MLAALNATATVVPGTTLTVRLLHLTQSAHDQAIEQMLAVCFFFSSRRRHTRYIGDWSSDVCSSDPSRRRHTDTSVTEVQTCALPIYRKDRQRFQAAQGEEPARLLDRH